MLIKKGEIYYADLGEVVGSEQGGVRPVLIVQNNIGNKFSPTVQIAPITSKFKTNMKTHFYINKNESGLRCDSVAMMEQIRTIDKSRLKSKVGEVDLSSIESQINEAIMISFGIPFFNYNRTSMSSRQLAQ